MRRKIILFILSSFMMLGAAAALPRLVAAESSLNVTVQTIPGDSVADKLKARTKSSWPWYLTRASGLVAAATLIVLLLSGIGQITGHTFRFLDPLTSWASHRALGIAFGIALLVHIFSILFDKFVPFTIWQLLIPWVSTYKPITLFGIHMGSLYVALGILGFYLTVLVIITSLVWVEKKPMLWKIIHLFSYVIIALVFFHSLFIGTDMTHGIVRWLWIVFNIFILVAAIARLRRAKTV